MKIKFTQIKEKDLMKLARTKGIYTLKKLAEVSGVNYPYLSRINKGHLVMDEKTYQKILTSIQTYG
jgi:predicted transcriptional regulator